MADLMFSKPIEYPRHDVVDVGRRIEFQRETIVSGVAEDIITTSPVWTHSRWVGNVREFVLENVVIDNYFFGVASVGSGGHESAVVFPVPASRR